MESDAIHFQHKVQNLQHKGTCKFRQHSSLSFFKYPMTHCQEPIKQLLSFQRWQSFERDLRKRIGFAIQCLFWSVRVFQLLNMTTRIIIHERSSILNISLDSYPFALAIFSHHILYFSILNLFLFYQVSNKLQFFFLSYSRRSLLCVRQ